MEVQDSDFQLLFRLLGKSVGFPVDSKVVTRVLERHNFTKAARQDQIDLPGVLTVIFI